MERTPVLSRRQLLGAAAAGTAVAAVAGVAAYELAARPPASAPATGGAGWPDVLSSPRGLAAHLLRRAGLGATSAELDAAASLSYGDLVDSLLSRQPEPPRPPADLTSASQVVRAWYTHMATTGAVFPERMTLFWHGLLTSSLASSFRLPLVYQQNATLRTQGITDLRSLLHAITFDPLMIRYLDLEESTAAAPNENYSRELMELFTLGAGAYTETDVREGARALSGIRALLVDASGQLIPPSRYRGATPQQTAAAVAALVAAGARFEGRLLARQHDSGTKTYLGHMGALAPDDVIDIILEQPACATHIATKALVAFCTPSPSAALVNAVATQFRASNYDIRTLMRAIVTSPDFTAPSAYRSLVRSPADHMVAAMRALGAPELAAAAVRAGPAMGQRLYDPPNVGGWPGGATWVTSSAWLARLDFVAGAVQSRAALPDPSQAVRDQLDSALSDATAAVLRAATDDAARWYAILGGPEFALK